MDAFTLDIIFEPLPQRFKDPTLEMYGGTSDPDDHLESFRALMILYGYSNALTCRTFQATFKGAAHRWFSSLPPRSISSWEHFSNLFLTSFISSRWCQKSVVSLMSIKQKKGKSLWSYIDNFRKEELEVHDLNPMVSMHTTINGHRVGLALKCSVAKTLPKAKLEFLKKAQKYIVAEEASSEDHQEREVVRHNGPPKKKRKGGDNHHHNNNSSKDHEKPPASALSYNQYTPLNSTRMQILMQIGEEKLTSGLRR
ncbi:PREDICTED: uncharacterized protein LOC104610163 [Nelumbo nucifera]|uniref:Uncharacterized protein LOC104610163 n=1 Tax=Nelumbo nucifera TaxID=4432 RepID=A0A1U8B2G0_NELNU|nr:PREDICTED: uncharacterized protein LOC104610163 [Nelumbo nucifera]